LVGELREVYPAVVERLVEVSRINGSAPPGVSDRLLKVEEKARGVEGFGVSGAWEPRLRHVELSALSAFWRIPLRSCR
jgi:hypothetical protein